jgi:hypothetical protein
MEHAPSKLPTSQAPPGREPPRARQAPAGVPAAPGPAAPATFAARSAAAAGDPLARTLAGAVRRRGRAELAGPVVARVRQKPSGSAATGTGSGLAVKMKNTRTAPVATPPRRSGRVRYAPNEVDEQVYWRKPRYGASNSVAGGTSVTATLGPAAGQTVNYGSVPGIKSCTAVNWLNANAYDGSLWIKGHLLNDNLGGPGMSKNLTPMTHTANMQYKAFESSVKNALAVCYSRAQRNLDGRRHYFGVTYDVDVIGQRWPGAPEAAVRAVAATVDASAEYVEKIGAAAPVAINDPPWAPALVPVNLNPAA